jgi:hypothetical protein
MLTRSRHLTIDLDLFVEGSWLAAYFDAEQGFVEQDMF